MEQIILNILEALRRGETVDDKALVKLIHAEARREGADKRDLAKRRLLPFYQRVKREEPARWAAWNVDSDLERQLLQVLRMKPRRTASGVATITVITKPWPCSGDCLFCPNDLRMPKSYLHAEPACARAEQNCFDPYLQVSARLTALSQMGHATDNHDASGRPLDCTACRLESLEFDLRTGQSCEKVQCFGQLLYQVLAALSGSPVGTRSDRHGRLISTRNIKQRRSMRLFIRRSAALLLFLLNFLSLSRVCMSLTVLPTAKML